MSRPMTWASGRNSSVDVPYRNSSPNGPLTMPVATASMFPWVIVQPLGRPVVPDV